MHSLNKFTHLDGGGVGVTGYKHHWEESQVTRDGHRQRHEGVKGHRHLQHNEQHNDCLINIHNFFSVGPISVGIILKDHKNFYQMGTILIVPEFALSPHL